VEAFRPDHPKGRRLDELLTIQDAVADATLLAVRLE
jgi:hypothetical protein